RTAPGIPGSFWLSGFASGSARAAGSALGEPIGLAVHLEDVDVMGEPIEERAGQALLAEGRRPLVEGQVRGDDGGGALVPLADQLEEQLCAGLRERHEAELVDDQELMAGELALQPQEAPLVPGLDEVVDDGRGGGA